MGSNCGSKEVAALLRGSIAEISSVSVVAIGRAYLDGVIRYQLKAGHRARPILDVLGGKFSSIFKVVASLLD